MTQKAALITGTTGQDGSYLVEFLLEKGYIVHGIKRWASSFNTQRVDHIYQDPRVNNAHCKLHYGDPTKTKQKLGWCLRSLRKKCAEMVAHGLAEAKNMPCLSTTATTSMPVLNEISL